MSSIQHLCGPQRFNVFWGEISPCEHLVQIYEDGSVLLDALEGFVAGGFDRGDAVILIATPIHLEALRARLLAAGHNVQAMVDCDRYVAVPAEDVLGRFMVGGWPDERRFETTVCELIDRARGSENRHVRGFGEMVALLWARGEREATVRLECLWQRICAERVLSLFCAYPRSGFTNSAGASALEICAVHSKMLPGTVIPAE